MLSVLGILLAVACASDVALHRIPNSLVIGIAATGVLSALLPTASFGIASSAAAGIITGAVIWPAWGRGWVGGGDLKLAAASAAWLGVARIPAYLLASAVAVGAVSILCYATSASAARSAVRRNLAIAARGVGIAASIGAENGRVQVPAGVGFAIGAFVTVAMTGGL